MTDEHEPLDIDSDKFKYDACSISNEECNGMSCRTCDIAIGELRVGQDEEDNSIISFKDKTQKGIEAQVNLYNTVLKCKSVDDAFTYMEIIDRYKFTKINGLLDREIIDKEYPHLIDVMNKLDLGACTTSYYSHRMPLITVYGTVVLATAPRIDAD